MRIMNTRRIQLAKVFSILIILVSISFLNISCDSNGSSGGDNSDLIGPNGGTVTSSDGRFKLEIPPGALSDEEKISITLNPSEVALENSLTNNEILVYDIVGSDVIFNLPLKIVGETVSGIDDTVYLIPTLFTPSNVDLEDYTFNVDLSNGNSFFTVNLDSLPSVFVLTDTIQADLPLVNPTIQDELIQPINLTSNNKDLIEISGMIFEDPQTTNVTYEGEEPPVVIVNEDNYKFDAEFKCINPGSANIIMTYSILGQVDLVIPNIIVITPFSLDIVASANFQCEVE